MARKTRKFRSVRKRKTDPTIHNTVAKYILRKGGAGCHRPKTGEQASRTRQKRAWKKELD